MPSPTPTPGPEAVSSAPWWRQGALMLVAILLLAYNLRPAATEIGPVMPNLQADLGMGNVAAGLLTSLPTICFAIFGFVAPAVANRVGQHRVMLLALIALSVGSVARTFVSDGWSFLALSTLALAGLAMGNVLAPSVIRKHFPNKIGIVTALYSLAMSIGVTTASSLIVPVADALGGWRPGFLVWALTAIIAVVPWIFALRHDKGRHELARRTDGIKLARVARTRLGWSMAVFFGLQSAQAYSIFGWLPSIYIDAGLSQADAGWMLGITTAVGVPLAFLWPASMSRNPRPLGLQLVISTCGLLGYLGLLIAPATLPWLWAILLAVGTSSFPLILAMFGLKARSGAGTVALSGFAQGMGYGIALFGPFLVGVLFDVTGGWSASVLLLIGLGIGMTVAGLMAITGTTIEDELGIPRESAAAVPLS